MQSALNRRLRCHATDTDTITKLRCRSRSSSLRDRVGAAEVDNRRQWLREAAVPGSASLRRHDDDRRPASGHPAATYRCALHLLLSAQLTRFYDLPQHRRRLLFVAWDLCTTNTLTVKNRWWKLRVGYWRYRFVVNHIDHMDVDAQLLGFVLQPRLSYR